MMLYPYRHDHQFEKYISQFMRVFSGFQTKDGVERDGSFNLKKVPVVYGNMSRVVSHVLQKRGVFQNNRIPIMAANLSSIQIPQERKKPHHHIDEIAYNEDGVQKGFQRIVGPAYTMNMDVSVYASSTTELFSIVEQILLIFNPRITIQVDNNIVNSDFITEILFESVNPEIQYPMGTDRQVVMMTLSFTVPIRLRYPYSNSVGVMDEIQTTIFTNSSYGFALDQGFVGTEDDWNDSLIEIEVDQTDAGKFLTNDGAEKFWTFINKNEVGLGNVNNTTDLNKPISIATQAALDQKLNIDDFNAQLNDPSTLFDLGEIQ